MSTSEVIKICVVGGAGRMGRRVLEVCGASDGLEAVSVLIRPDDQVDGLGNLRVETEPLKAFEGADVVIDFSAPPSIERTLSAAADLGVGYILASTGLSKDAEELLKQAATKIPLIVASNCSLGVNVLNALVETAAKALSEFDIEIFEIHHNQKRDAPSGTALTLAEAVNNARPLESKFSRSGNDSIRETDSLGVVAARGGDVAGEHTVFYFGQGERLELTHRATSPTIFAQGAVKAAQWLSDKEPNLYSMRDVLGLEDGR